MNDFIIVIDTREQTPFTFSNNDANITIINKTLDTGDYSIKGFEKHICIERKSKSDFCKSITYDRDRFKQELLRMMFFERKYVVVECELSEMLSPIAIKKNIHKPRPGYVRGKVDRYVNIAPNAIKRTVESIMVRYNVPIVFCIDRDHAEEFTLCMLKKYYNLKRKGEIG